MTSLSIRQPALPGTSGILASIQARLIENRFVLLLLALAAAPLLWPTVPPLTDLPNHMSRYKIGLDYATSPYFHRWFEFRWVLVGNMGVDLLVTLLAPALGVEFATKIVIVMTPVIAVAGIAMIAREVHGSVPRTAALAAVFVYNYPFNFGFVNFTLASALALLAFGIWLRLGRIGAWRLRAALFVPIGFLVWLTHVAGWGILGVLIFAWEVAQARARQTGWGRATGSAVASCLPLLTPLIPMLFWSARIPHGSMGTFNYSAARKLAILFLCLRNGIPMLDLLSVMAILVVCLIAVVRPDLGYDRRLIATGATLTIVYLLMPADLMGSGHADLRIAPYAMMILVLALKPTADTTYTRALGLIAVGYFAAQMAYHSARYADMARAQEHSLEALEHLPAGSTVFAFSSVGCSAEMDGNRMDHVHRLAVVRREAFTNGNWPYPAVQTLRVRPEMIAGYEDDSSQLLEPIGCREGPRNLVRGALHRLPRDRYRYFWLLDTPRRLWPTRSWLRPVWSNDRTILYAVAPPGAEKNWKPRGDRVPARMHTIG